MNLIIDRGNSQTKLYGFSGDELIRTASGPSPGREKSFIWPDWISGEHIEGVIVSDVEGSFQGWKELLNEYRVIQMGPDLVLPVKLAYDTPGTLGHDRIANCSGAWASNPEMASMVIDCGTCLKMDVVDPEGTFIGGSISPGLHVRYRALAEYTGKLPLVEPLAGEIPFAGTSTEMSIRSGVQNGMVAEINTFLHRYRVEYPDLNIFLTGGDTEHFAAILKSPIFVAPDLTARGLNEILKLNLP